MRDGWQRSTAIERNDGRVAVSCAFKDIVHGLFSEKEDGEEEEESQHCSLIVLHLRFDPINLGRRIKRVQITVRFSALNAYDDDPIVDSISPEGFFFVYPTSQKETVTVGASVNVGGNILGAELGGELKRDRTVEKEVTNAGTVRGAIETKGRNYGKPNTASWTLMENPTDKTGTPVSLRASILVRRDPDVNFQAHFAMQVTPDNLTQAQTWFKSNPKDDPVFFKIDKKPTNKLRHYSKETVDEERRLKLVNNLGSLNLESPEFSDITFRTMWKNSQKVK
ncbi:hypothetical protein B0T17DRAFT_587409 [Bombardia bombarda]|uniref:Uncharacterized protein n=1 Tax=Bombardia bombarda TaxID=252184 RepID=A0AA39XLD1_9PEZI|nr:hypothetical protein B0T17DRAFT_587409 [Bombardia bombarda]